MSTNRASEQRAARERASDPRPRLSTLKSRAFEEVKHFSLMFVYLWVLLGLFVLHESLVLKAHQINFSGYGLAFVNALVLAKVMLIAEDLHIGRGFEEKPLFIPILYKSVLFAAVFIAFHIAESVLLGVWRGKTVAESFPEIGGDHFNSLLVVGVIITIALIPFFAFTEVDRVLGEGRLRALIFSGRSEEATGPG